MESRKTFTIEDMRSAFIAGEDFEADYANVNIGEKEELTAPDFGDWMLIHYGTTV